MKAVYFDKHGEPGVLTYTEDYNNPEPKDNEILVKIDSTSINKIDTVMRRGYPGIQLPLPHVPGGDIAGTVAGLGSNVRDFKGNDRVVSYPIVLPENRDPKFEGLEHLNDGWKYFGMHLPGSYAEYICVPAENLLRLPANVSFEQAAALPIAGLTAYHAVETVAQLNENDLFFIWGGSGGLGSIAVQLAKNRGAAVIATVGKEEKKSAVYEFGADHVFNHYEEDVETEVKKLFPSGVDVIVDYVGPATFDKTFRMVRKNGKILLCGMITGKEITLNIQQTYFRHINILGLYLGTMEEFSGLLNMVAEGTINPLIHEVMLLKEAARGHEMIHSSEHLGKIVLKCS